MDKNKIEVVKDNIEIREDVFKTKSFSIKILCPLSL